MPIQKTGPLRLPHSLFTFHNGSLLAGKDKSIPTQQCLFVCVVCLGASLLGCILFVCLRSLLWGLHCYVGIDLSLPASDEPLCLGVT